MTDSPGESADTEAATVALLAARLDDSYGLRVRELKFLGGELDRNYRVSTIDGATYLAKLRMSAECQGHLQWQEDILVHLADRQFGVAVPTLVRTLDGNRDLRVDVGAGRCLLKVLNWVSGTELVNVVDHSEELLTELGATAARVTKALEGFTSETMPKTHHWDVTRSDEVIESCLAENPELGDNPDVPKALSWFTDVRPRFEALPKAVLHNDLNDNNVLVEVRDGTQAVAGVLDFNDALYSVRVAELAIAGAYTMLRKSDPLGALGFVVAGYHSVTPLTDEELDVVYQLATARLCVQALTWAARGRTNPTAYGSMRMRYTLPALRRALQIDPRVAITHLRAICGKAGTPSSEGAAKLLESLSPTTVLDNGLAPNWINRAPDGDDGFDDTDQRPVLGSAHLTAHAHRADIWRHNVGEPETISIGTSFWSRFAVDLQAPMAGRVVATEPLIIEHPETDGPSVLYTIWHGVKTLVDDHEWVDAGRTVAEGPPADSSGDPGWRIQVTADQELAARLPDYCRPTDAAYWAAVTVDPAPLFGTAPTGFGIAPAADRLRRDTASVQARRERHLASSQRSYFRRPMTLVRGRGVWMYDADGIRYLDAINNVTHVGHAEPRIVEAAHRQMRLLNTNSRFLYPQLAEYAERLTATLPDPLDTVFFVCTGSEANDLAIRMARQVTGRRDVMVIDGAYHGNTTAVTDISPNRYNGPGGSGRPELTHEVVVPDRYRGPYGYDDPDAGPKYAADVGRVVARLEEAGTPPAAFIAESLIGTGGNHVLPDGYLAASFAHIRAAGGLCISDEVQVGVGRMGTHFWGFQANGVVPDIVTMGKPMGNGHPIAAVVTTREIADAFDTGMKYFNTFAGNPVSCAVGTAVLDVVQGDGLQQHAGDVGRYFAAALESLQVKFPLIGDVRGHGLYLGLDLVTDPVTKAPATDYALAVSERLKERSIVMYPNGTHNNVLKIKPPMVFSRNNVDLFVDRLADVLAMTDILPAETSKQS